MPGCCFFFFSKPTTMGILIISLTLPINWPSIYTLIQYKIASWIKVLFSKQARKRVFLTSFPVSVDSPSFSALSLLLTLNWFYSVPYKLDNLIHPLVTMECKADFMLKRGIGFQHFFCCRPAVHLVPLQAAMKSRTEGTQ